MCEISVIVPAYNVGEYLRDCLDSLLAQSFRDFEALVVDDGSTDSTRAIIERYCAADSRLRCLRQPNAGVSAARNLALAHARGRYVAFLDGDDLYTPRALEALHARAAATGADLVIGDYEIFDRLHTWGVNSMRTLLEKPAYDRFDQNLLLCYVVWNKLFRRSVIEEHGLRFPPIAFAEDSVFSMSFAYRSERIVTVDEVVCRYRRRTYQSELSATQVITMRSETDHLAAHAGVRHEATAQLDEWAAQAAGDEERARRVEVKRSYLDGLLGKEVANLIDLRYRTFWTAEEGVAGLIADRVETASRGMSYKTWSDLRRSVRDLPLGALPRSAEEVAARPLVTVAVFGTEAEARALDQTLHTLYIQGFPRFKVVVPAGALAWISEEYTDHANLAELASVREGDFYNEALDRAGSDYLLFSRAGVLYRSTALLRMFSALKNGNADLATFPVARVSDDDLPHVYPLQRLAFETNPSARDYRSDPNHRFDCLLPNKLVRRSYLNATGFRFTGNSVSDAERMLEPACFLKSQHKVVHMPLRETEFSRRFLGGRRFDLRHRALLFARRRTPVRRRSREVLLLDTRGQGFAQNLLSTRDAVLRAGLTPRFLLTSLESPKGGVPDSEAVSAVKRAVGGAGAIVCATDSIPAALDATTTEQPRILLQSPRLNTVLGLASGVLAPGSRYTDVVVQNRSFEASVRGATRAVGLPATDVMSDETRAEAARERLLDLRPDARGKRVIVLTSHLAAKKLFGGVDVERLALWLKSTDSLLVALAPGLSTTLADYHARLSDTVFDATGCFLSFDQLTLADIVVTTRFTDAVYRAASGRPLLFWSCEEQTGELAKDLPAALRRLSFTDLNELPRVLESRPWTEAVEALAQTFVKPNGEGCAERVAALIAR